MPKTDTKKPTDLQEASRLLAEVTKLLGPIPALTAKERIRALKLPKGGEKIVAILASLSDRLGLKVPSHSTAAMLADLAEAESLVALHAQLASATKQVADQIFLARTRTWMAATVHYTMASRISRKDGDVQATLAPVRSFFARPRKKKNPEEGGDASPAAKSMPGESGAKTTGD